MKKTKDLGIKIGTKTEAMWTNVKNKCQADMETLSNELIVNKALLDVAIARIQQEQDKQKALNKSKT